MSINPILFIFSGLPGSGKSTLSQRIAKKYDASYLQIDTIEQGLRDLCNFDIEAEGYRLAYRIAADNLKLGHNVVADSCNPINITRREWENVATENDSISLNIEITCSDKNEHRKRAETRISEIDNLKLPTWEDIKNREYHPWNIEIITINTADKSINDSFKELDNKIYNYLANLMKNTP